MASHKFSQASLFSGLFLRVAVAQKVEQAIYLLEGCWFNAWLCSSGLFYLYATQGRILIFQQN